MPEEESIVIKHRRRALSATKIIIIGYAVMILIGGLLLTLPIATKSGQSAGFLTALFTATSSSCVTGLILQDTYTFWSSFGQGIIITLIQIGGLGFISMATLIGLLTRKRIGLKQRVLMRDSISAPYMGGIVRLAKFVLIGTAVFELIGAALMAIVFVPMYGLKGIWFAIFHSISAFCNAGFDLMGIEQQFSSITTLATNPIINYTIMLLIIIGGLGFFVWEDIKRNGLRFKHYKLHTKMVLVMTGLLIFIPAVYFLIVDGAAFAGGMPVTKALFQSVTTRTAGFNSVDFNQMTEGSRLVSIALMLAGASPGSTGGGIKTTTLLVLISCVGTVFRRENSVHIFGRALHTETIRKAVSIFTIYIGLFFVSSIVISEIEGISVLTTMFECASAIGTVGLTLGITPSLGLVSKLILMALMFYGRVGCMTLLLTFTDSQVAPRSRYPHEDITVG